MTLTGRGNRLLAEKQLARMNEDLDRIRELKLLKDEIGAELDLLERRTAPVLAKYGKQYEYDGSSFTAAMPTQTTYDDAGLRKALGERTWQQVVKQVLDTKALGAMVTSGKVSPWLVAEHATVTDKKPYVLVNPLPAAKEPAPAKRGGRKAA